MILSKLNYVIYKEFAILNDDGIRLMFFRKCFLKRDSKLQNPVESEQSIIVLDFSRVRKETIITRAPMSG